MYESAKKGEVRHPRHSHYVSISNGLVYPANRNLPGYEDDNPGDWRAANSEEVERFKEGLAPKVVVPEGDVNLSEPAPVRSAPSTLKLEDDGPQPPANTERVEVVSPVYAAAEVVPAPASVPPPSVVPAPVPVTPAFKID